MTHRASPSVTACPPAARRPAARARGWLRALARAWTTRHVAGSPAAAPVMEEYEQRLLYSADLAPVALLSPPAVPAVEQRLLDTQGEYVAADTANHAQALELVFVDGAIEDVNVIINQIDSAGTRHLAVIELDAAADGVAQISAALQGRSDIAAVHIVSHGADGELQLGTTRLNAGVLAARAAEIAQWGDALTAGADILLYGCEVAADSAGEAFVRQVSVLTRADVAASSNLTGSARLSGDWALEFTFGAVTTTTLMDATAAQAWSGTLATFVVTDKNGSGAGTLARAIEDANSTPGADIITFQVSGSGAPVINIDTPLTITDTVTIDGTRNNGVLVNGGLPGIILDGGGLAGNGLTLADGADGSTIRGLVIRDFTGNGIEIAAGADGNTIAGNNIGNLWEDGTRGGSNDNGGAGIHINSRLNIIGGATAADRNLISGNGGPGILIENPAGATVLIGPNNVVRGNWIGIEGDGSSALANSVGIQLTNGAQWDYILGNRIEHNTGSGILIGASGAAVHDFLIGNGAGDENTIALNGGDGVTVVSGIHNSIVRNNIFGNGGLGIDLRNGAASAGVTANDTGDADSGGNELQNTPVLFSAQAVSGTQIRVIGTLNAAANTQHLVEFFANTTADASGHGEGQTYLGSITFNTDGSGNASIDTLINATLPVGSFISATATNYYTVIIVPVRGSTSEFSQNVVLGNNAPVLDASRTPELLSVPANAALPLGATGTLVSALVDFAAPAGQLDNVSDSDSGARLGIAITGVDTANGTLYYSTNGGGGWTAVGAVSDTNALLLGADGSTRLYYRANAGASGTLASAVTFRAWDRSTGTAGTFMDTSTNGGASAFSANTDVVSITVTAVNSAPANTVPGAQTTTEDTTLAIGGISVNDVNNNLASTQLTVNDGVLAVNLAGGAVIIAGTNNSADLTLGGTQAQINTALATLTYRGNADFAGSDLLRVLSTDGAVTPLSDTDTVAITVNAVNDAPVSSGGAVSGSEDTSYVFTWADFNVTDVDNAITGATALRMNALPVEGVLQYLSGSVWTPVALGQLIAKSSIDAGELRFVPDAEESGYDGYAASGVGNQLQDYARFSFTPVQSSAITIVNPDGEANGLGEGASQNPAVGWTTSGAAGGAQNFTAAEYPFDHDAALYVNAGATLTQTLGVTFSSARDYSLSFEFGWRNDAGFPTEPGFRVELWAGATLMGSMDETAVAGVKGAFTAAVLNMVGTASGAVEGSALQIRLVGTNSQASFDNLRLLSFNAATDIGVPAQMTVDIAPVNDAPTATNLSTAETYTEDTALNLTNIVVSDVDSANVTATLTLSNAAAGSLNTATSGAVTSTYNAGTGVWTASGALADVNTLLAGLTFTPAADFNGAFTLATSISDGVAAPVTGSKAMTGTAVNDGPTATITLPTYSATEQVNLTLSGTGLSVADVDAGAAVVQVSVSIVSGTLIAAGGSTGVSISSVGPSLIFSGNLNQINNLLSGSLGGSLVYVINSDTPPASDTLTLQISDLGNSGGAALTAQDTAVINITAVNDAPTASNLSAAETYTEDTPLNLINIVVGDVDSASVTATLTLSNTAAGSLSTATSGAVTSTYNAGTGVWTASGALANVNTLLAGVSFNPAANFNGNFSIASSISDGVAPALTGSKAVTGIAVNDAPAATNLNAAETYTEDTALNLTDIVISDIDSANVTATLTLSNTAAGSLSTATSGAVTSTYNAGTGVWTASGALTDVNTLLAGVSFNPAANFNGNFSIASSISDGVAPALTGTKAVTGIAVNDAPAATNLNAAETYTEDTALNLTDIGISDIDSANVTATLTLSNTAAGSLSTATSGAVTSTYNAGTGVWTASGALADVNTLLAGVSFNPAANFNGNFSIASSISDGVAPALTGSKAVTGIAVNDAPATTPVTLAAIAEDSGARLITQAELLANASDVDGPALTATGLAISSGAGTLVNNGNGTWGYTPAPNDDTAVSFSYTVSDGVLTAAGTASLDITPVNQAPVTTPVTLAAMAEDSGTQLITAAQLLANASDVDGPALTVTGLAIGSGGGTLVDNGNGTWSYTPALNDDSAVGFSYTISDGSLTAAGTASLDLTPVNDAPAAADRSIAIAGGGEYVLGVNDFAYTDVEGDSLATVRITVLPVAGTLALDGNAVAPNQDITAADIAAGKLRFVPAPGGAAQTAAAIGFQVNDGALYSADSHVLSIAVALLPPAANTVQQTVDTSSAATVPAAAQAVATAAPAAAPATASGPVSTLAQGAGVAAALAPASAPASLLDGAAAPQDNRRVGDAGEEARRPAALVHIPPVNLLSFMAGPALPQLNFDAQRPPDATVSERTAAATSSTAFIGELDRLRDNTRAEAVFERNVVVSSVAAGAGMSVGYVLWLLRGGLLMSSLLSTLPAWRFIDPLPVLGRLDDDDDETDGDDDSLESMVRAEDTDADA